MAASNAPPAAAADYVAAPDANEALIGLSINRALRMLNPGAVRVSLDQMHAHEFGGGYPKSLDDDGPYDPLNASAAAPHVCRRHYALALESARRQAGADWPVPLGFFLGHPALFRTPTCWGAGAAQADAQPDTWAAYAHLPMRAALKVGAPGVPRGEAELAVSDVPDVAAYTGLLARPSARERILRVAHAMPDRCACWWCFPSPIGIWAHSRLRGYAVRSVLDFATDIKRRFILLQREADAMARVHALQPQLLADDDSDEESQCMRALVAATQTAFDARPEYTYKQFCADLYAKHRGDDERFLHALWDAAFFFLT